MKVQPLPIHAITVSPDRMREDLGDLRPLAKDIKTRGLLNPVTVTEDLTLVAGRRRLEAAKLAGLDQIDANILPSTFPEEEARYAELSENIMRKDFTWQERCLAEACLYEDSMSQYRGKWNMTKEAARIGINPQTLKRHLLLASFLPGVSALAGMKSMDEAEAYLIQEGLIKGVSPTKALETYEAAKTYASAHYSLEGTLDGMEKVNPGSAGLILYDGLPCGNLFKLCHRALRNNTFMLIWGDHPGDDGLAGFQVDPTPSIWVKTLTEVPDPRRHGKDDLTSAYEMVWVARKGNPTLKRPLRSNVFSYPPPRKRIVEGEKPLALLEDILATFCNPLHLVCVPILGSGNTLRAAYRLGRSGFGFGGDAGVKQEFLRRVDKDHTP